MSKINIYAKAIISGLVAGLGSIQVANADGKITAAEWIQIASVIVAALGFTWAVPNGVAPAAPVAAPPAPPVPPVAG